MKVDKLVSEIITIINVLGEQEMGKLSDDTLSRLSVKLASYKASLGEPVATAFKDALDAEADYQSARAEEYQKLRDSGKGAGDSGELKHIGAKEAFKAWNQKRYEHKLLEKLSVDCHDLIGAIQGRLINLHTERKESKHGL